MEPGQAGAGNSPGFPIGEALLADGKLTLKVPIAASIEFTGTVAGNTMAGTWTQAALGRSIPLTLTRQ
ncbi:hypothetical protein D3C83_250810 [compost metagenome]